MQTLILKEEELSKNDPLPRPLNCGRISSLVVFFYSKLYTRASACALKLAAPGPCHLIGIHKMPLFFSFYIFKWKLKKKCNEGLDARNQILSHRTILIGSYNYRPYVDFDFKGRRRFLSELAFRHQQMKQQLVNTHNVSDP